MRPLSRRLKRWLIVLAALLVAGIAFIWTLPEIVKWQALKQIPAITGRAASIEDIDINLFTGRVAIKKFRLAEADPAQTFVEFERFDVRVIPWRSLFGNIRVSELRLTAPTVNLVRLTPSEFRLLTFLAEEPERVYSRREIMQHLWQSEYVGDERATDMHVSNLRRKIERDPDNPERVVTVRGIGYKLVPA